ncbi:arrestin domain-containing protein 3-like [Festucalex cinctus]
MKTFKDFNINFNALSESNTFSSGDLITGQISFELSKATKISSIKMCLTGKVNVHWSSGTGKRKRTHHARIDFFNLKSMILQEGVVEGRTTLPPGRHVYSFTCQIPQGDFPTSFRGPYGQIVYDLTVGIDRPWRMSKDFVTQLNFVHHVDSNRPELMAPLSGSNSMNVCSLSCTSGLITMAGSLEKKGFTRGETVRIICDISNASSRTLTPKAKLKQKQQYCTLRGVQRKLIVKNLDSVTGLPISAHTSETHTEMMITIPADSSLTISNCSLLQVEYEIELSLCLRASSDLTVLFPIVLCDIPLHPHNLGNNVVTRGSHSYPFTFQIPQLNLPSTFKGSHGKIKYSLEANLSRSMRTDSKAKTHFIVINKSHSDPMLMSPQQGITDKKLKFFSSGTVRMEANIEKTGYFQGEGVKVVAYILNKSSRDVRPKYCLYKKYSYFASSKRKVETKKLLKEVGESIPPSAGQSVTRIITIPPTTCASILNCNIIKAEYRLKVYLDVKYASDPEIKFPVVVLPAVFEHNSNVGVNMNFMQEPTASPPPSYEDYVMYPSSTGFDGKS